MNSLACPHCKKPLPVGAPPRGVCPHCQRPLQRPAETLPPSDATELSAVPVFESEETHRHPAGMVRNPLHPGLLPTEESKPRLAPIVDAPPPGETAGDPPPRARVEPAQTRMREYRDGILMTETGERIGQPQAARALITLKLPYSSTAVLWRLGNYDIVGELGRGGMGAVFRAYAVNLQRFVAIKVIKAQDLAGERQIIRFHNEAMLAARVRHPNIVTVFDSGEKEGMHYFVMDCVEGGTLRRFIDRAGAEFPMAVVPIFIKVARALQAAHEKGVIHRDIKPENILVDKTGEPFLTDFGVAKNATEDSAFTHAGAIMGTPYYMPPEQANGETEHIGAWSDVYALGATLYHVLCGVVPFDGPTAVAVLIQVTRKEPRPVARVALERLKRIIPPDVETICQKAMEKEAARRYPSMAALADDLERFSRGEPITARPVGPAERLNKALARNRPLLITTGILASVVLMLTVGFTAVMLDNVERSGKALLQKDLADAAHQAGTLERAIRVNMLQGRADQARLLLRKLSENPSDGLIQVVRTNRQLAYTDRATRDAVEKRLNDPAVLEKIGIERPDMLPVVEMLKKVGFASMERSGWNQAAVADVNKEEWATMLQEGTAHSYTEERNGVPYLVVMRPIENSAECKTCHAPTGNEKYGLEKMRAVLLIRRSQQELHETIQGNRRATLAVGALTVAAFLAMMAFFARVFGIRVRPQEFGRTA